MKFYVHAIKLNNISFVLTEYITRINRKRKVEKFGKVIPINYSQPNYAPQQFFRLSHF